MSSASFFATICCQPCAAVRTNASGGWPFAPYSRVPGIGGRVAEIDGLPELEPHDREFDLGVLRIRSSLDRASGRVDVRHLACRGEQAPSQESGSDHACARRRRASSASRQRRPCTEVLQDRLERALDAVAPDRRPSPRSRSLPARLVARHDPGEEIHLVFDPAPAAERLGGRRC